MLGDVFGDGAAAGQLDRALHALATADLLGGTLQHAELAFQLGDALPGTLHDLTKTGHALMDIAHRLVGRGCAFILGAHGAGWVALPP